jgi:pimeloyl-ACP methyl ester carboxylesterase
MEEHRVRAPWVVLGGWAVAPEILRPVFGGEGVVYVDVNELTPLLVGPDEVLRPDWRARAAEFILARGAKVGGFSLAGWSTGAMVAASVAGLLGPRGVALFSSADGFCGGKGGWSPRVIRRMKKRLAEDPAPVRADFEGRCRDPGDGPIDKTCLEKAYPVESLGAGLDFLEHYRRDPAADRAACPVIAFHGRDDKIVPSGAGRASAESAGARFAEFDGGHLFFTNAENAAALRGLL